MPNTTTTDSVDAQNADLQLLVFTLCNEEFALNLTDAREIILLPEITPVPNMPSYVYGVANLRGRVMTVVTLADILGLKQSSDEIYTHDKHVIILEKGDDVYGLLIDSANEVMRTFTDHLRKTPEILESSAHADLLDGVVLFEETGRMILRIDTEKLFSKFSLSSTTPS